MTFNSFFRKFLSLVQPKVAIGGLEISDTAVRFVEFKGNELRKFGISLNAGIIEDGKLKDRGGFLQALYVLKSQIGKIKDRIPVIICIPPNHVYTQAFNLPLLKDMNIQEAAVLNLKMLSPTDIRNVYYDWQILSEAKYGGGLELLGAFVNKSVVDDFSSVFEEAGFSALAVEFSGLAISRLLKEKSVGIDLAKPNIVLVVSSDGLDFLILKDGNLYFSYFVSWASIGGGISEDSREILLKVFSSVLIQEMKKVFTFYSSHWGGQAGSMTLITHGLFEEIEKMVKETFPAIQVKSVTLKDFADLAPSWFSPVGSALRGLVPRSEDQLISLEVVGTEERFKQSEIIIFFKLWRNVILISLGFLAVVFAVGDIAVANIESQVQKQADSLFAGVGGAEVEALKQKAADFNALLNRAISAKKQTNDFSPIFSQVSDLAAGYGVKITGIFVDGGKKSAVVSGRAASESVTVNFKNKLASQGKFKNVTLPLSGITANTDGSVNFSLTIEL